MLRPEVDESGSTGRVGRRPLLVVCGARMPAQEGDTMIADVPLSYEDLVNLVSTLSDGDLEFTVGQPLYDKLLDARNRVAPRRSGRNACVILCSDPRPASCGLYRAPHGQGSGQPAASTAEKCHGICLTLRGGAVALSHDTATVRTPHRS